MGVISTVFKTMWKYPRTTAVLAVTVGAVAHPTSRNIMATGLGKLKDFVNR